MVLKRLLPLVSSLALCVAPSDCAHALIPDWFSSLSPQAQVAKNRLEGLDAVIENALKDYEVPGLAVGIIVDGHTIYTKGFGYRNIETKKPVTPNTLFAIGSCSKAFTSFLAGTFIDEGSLKWDTEVVDILPSFQLHNDYATRHATLRDLLTHRTGIPRHDYMWYNGQFTRSQLIERLRHLEPVCQMREQYHYNNLMYVAASSMLEAVSGKSWETLIAERIFTPLNMKHSTCHIQDMQKAPDYACPYIQKNDQLVQMAFRDNSVIGPAGGSLNSNIADLSHWVKMQLNQGTYNKQPIIHQSTLQEMHSPQILISGTPEHKVAVLSTYGIGWGILSYRGNYQISHDGAAEGYTSVVTLLPEQGIGIIILSNKNLTPLPRFLSLEITDRLLGLSPHSWYHEGLDFYLKAKTTRQQLQKDLTRPSTTTPSHPLQDYVGQFEHPAYGLVEITNVDGQLKLHFNHITSSLHHWNYDIFIISEESEELHFSRIGTKITFRINELGEIDELVIPEPGAPSLIFKKTRINALDSVSYLQKFTGLYQIYGKTIEIILKGHSLIAIIPGQTPFELVPGAENMFTVKSKIGYTIGFVLDSNGIVDEAWLTQPYGTFTAKRKR